MTPGAHETELVVGEGVQIPTDELLPATMVISLWTTIQKCDTHKKTFRNAVTSDRKGRPTDESQAGELDAFVGLSTTPLPTYSLSGSKEHQRD